MKISHIGHACILVEVNGLRVLSDPWWRGPCFGAQWWIFPEPELSPLLGGRVDYIYISHGHEDHFHPGTLRTLDRSAQLLVARGCDVAPAARALGFNVIEVAPASSVDLGKEVTCRIVPTLGRDSFMTLTDGHETVVNLNDALHPLPRMVRNRYIRRLRSWHPEIDYAFCGYGVASHFPNCYVIPGKDREASGVRRQLFFSHAWADIVKSLSPRFAFPFAADVVLLEEDLLWANEVVHNTERPPQLFQRLYPTPSTEVRDISPGFSIADGRVECLRLRTPPSTSRKLVLQQLTRRGTTSYTRRGLRTSCGGSAYPTARSSCSSVREGCSNIRIENRSAEGFMRN